MIAIATLISPVSSLSPSLHKPIPSNCPEGAPLAPLPYFPALHIRVSPTWHMHTLKPSPGVSSSDPASQGGPVLSPPACEGSITLLYLCAHVSASPEAERDHYPSHLHSQCLALGNIH